ncbi:MAG: hypothetical protein K6A44_05000 [bacterium]|nr:hypothetical protein [bacterium]
MAIAALNALVQALVQEKAQLEFNRTVIDARRQTLAFQKSELSSQYQAKLALKYLDTKDADGDGTNTSVETFNWKEFQAQFDVAQDKLNAQDKIMEMERTNLDTKIEAITTSLESAEKQLGKNVESDMKGMNQ